MELGLRMLLFFLAAIIIDGVHGVRISLEKLTTRASGGTDQLANVMNTRYTGTVVVGGTPYTLMIGS